MMHENSPYASSREGCFFCTIRAEVKNVESYDNDEMILFLDDDLFFCEDDVERVQSESSQTSCR